MKRVIDGVTYNTDTSTEIAKSEWSRGENEDVVGILYQTRGGAFFVHYETSRPYHDPRTEEWTTKVTDEFAPMTRDQAHKWTLEGDVEIIAEVFDLPPEAAAGDAEKPEALIYVRVPPALKARAEAAAKAAGQSMNAWALRCFETCAASTKNA